MRKTILGSSVFMVILFLMMSLSFVGCTSKTAETTAAAETTAVAETTAAAETTTTAAAKKIVIGETIPGLDNPFWVAFKQGVENAAKELGIEVNTTDSKNDPATQLTQIETMIAQKVTGIVLVPIEMEAGIPMVQAIKKAGIAVITSNRRVDMEYGEGKEGPISHTGWDDVAIGKMFGKLAIDALKEKYGEAKGKVAVLSGTKGSSAQIDRDKGINEYLVDYPNVKIVLQDFSEFTPELSLSITETWLAANPKGSIDVIICHDDPTGLASLKATEDAKRTEITVIGGGGSFAAMDAIKAGSNFITAFADPKLDGYTGIKTMYDYLNGEKIPLNVPVEIYPVTKKNYMDYTPAW